MIILSLKFLILLLILFAAAVGLSYGSERLAGRWGANFVGSIVLALVTTLPEYLFVFWASLKGEFGIAIGSITGAAAMLVTLGYGIVILTSTTRLSRKPVKEILLSPATRVDAAYLLVTAIVALLLAAIGNVLGLIDAAILTVIFAFYVWHVFLASRKIAHLSQPALPRPETEPGSGSADRDPDIGALPLAQNDSDIILDKRYDYYLYVSKKLFQAM